MHLKNLRLRIYTYPYLGRKDIFNQQRSIDTTDRYRDNSDTTDRYKEYREYIFYIYRVSYIKLTTQFFSWTICYKEKCFK